MASLLTSAPQPRPAPRISLPSRRPYDKAKAKRDDGITDDTVEQVVVRAEHNAETSCRR